MTLDLSDFISMLSGNIPLFIVSALTLGVILVNGWTDAPNAIATCIATGCMKPRKAILMAACFNFLGIVVMTTFNASVAMTIYHMVDFGNNTNEALIALCAALFAIILWATAAWSFGIPTSESHALIAGLSGAAIAVHGNLSGISGSEWTKVIFGLLFSLLAGFCSGCLTIQITELISRHINLEHSSNFFRQAQIAGAASMAFMHGAQDGQKFMGVFLLGIFLSGNHTTSSSLFIIPFWLMILCSLVMALGTSIGGMRIIQTVGMEMVQLKRHQGFAADLAGAICLAVASLTGIPVSTTHTKTTAIMGVCATKNSNSLNWSIVKEMLTAWILTFPGCGLIGYIMGKLFLNFFQLS
ncbi:MAG: inorganic phosphate transporter [Lachnospiraceae bacterium]